MVFEYIILFIVIIFISIIIKLSEKGWVSGQTVKKLFSGILLFFIHLSLITVLQDFQYMIIYYISVGIIAWGAQSLFLDNEIYKSALRCAAIQQQSTLINLKATRGQ